MTIIKTGNAVMPPDPEEEKNKIWRPKSPARGGKGKRVSR